MSLRSKLSRLDARAADPPAAPVTPAPSILDDLRARIEATLARTALPATPRPRRAEVAELPFDPEPTPLGVLHARARRLAFSTRTGRTAISGAYDAQAELLALLAVDPSLSGADPRRALFLDTEATGLSGGAGTLAFLVGLASWDDDRRLQVEQLFVRAPGEEAPMLDRVRARIEQASMLVTFNGKSFDLPLLRGRYVMARMEPPREPAHLDLLHVARRIHGKRIREGCKLQALERAILGFERVDDVPGAEVAQRYGLFLQTGDPAPLAGVIEHNAWDVVTMVSLVGVYGEAMTACARAAAPRLPDADGALAPEDLVGVARTLRRAGALDRAREAAEAAVAGGAGPESLRARAEIAKARGDRAAALADFEALAASVDDPRARLELAKLYEHFVKEPARALEWTARGTGEAPELQEKRAARLEGKAARARA